MGTVTLADVTELQTKKISELSELASAGGIAELPIVESGVTRKIAKGNFADLDQALYVAKNGIDTNTGAITDPFLTIQAAIDYAIANISGNLTIKVYPGTYTEQIHSAQNIFIIGVIPTYPINESKLVILDNTGVDADHYPLRGNDGDYYAIQNMVIRTNDGGTFGKICNSRFRQCRFEGGYFIEGTEDVSVYATWYDCAFYNCKGFNLTGVAPNGRYLVFERCWNGWNKTATFESTHTVGNAVVDMDGGHLSFTKLSIKGDWYHFAKNYHSYGSVRHEYDTIKGIVYRGVTITNGIHFVSNPASFKMVNCGMEDGAESPVPAGTADITGDVTITNVEFHGNAPHNGLCGCIHITDPIRDVGGGRNRYLSVQDAIDSIATGEKVLIRLYDSAIDLAELTIADNISVVIDGMRAHSLTFTANIAELGLNQLLTFSRLESITGGAVEINGNGAEFHMHACNHSSEFHVVLTSGVGATLHMNNSSFNADASHPALAINSVDPSMLIEYSKLKGAIGQPAVHFTADADGKFKAKYSTFIHGDGGGNYPITRTPGFTVQVAIYSSAGNDDLTPAPGGISNSISGANNTDDTALDF